MCDARAYFHNLHVGKVHSYREISRKRRRGLSRRPSHPNRCLLDLVFNPRAPLTAVAAAAAAAAAGSRAMHGARFFGFSSCRKNCVYGGNSMDTFRIFGLRDYDVNFCFRNLLSQCARAHACFFVFAQCRGESVCDCPRFRKFLLFRKKKKTLEHHRRFRGGGGGGGVREQEQKEKREKEGNGIRFGVSR